MNELALSLKAGYIFCCYRNLFAEHLEETLFLTLHFFFFLFFALNMKDLFLLTFSIKTGFVSDLFLVVKSDSFGINNESAS